MKSDEEPVAEEGALPQWEDLVFSAPEPPEEWDDQMALSFSDEPPPQLIRTVNLIPKPEHGLRGPEDLDGIAQRILSRAREGITDVFLHDDYAGRDAPEDEWARAVAEHQTGIPYTQPVYFYEGAQKQIAGELINNGRYPLAGQCQQSVTSALCIGGWDGGPYGDIGCGRDAQPACARLGKGWKKVDRVLSKWSDELWDEVKVGSCLFWSSGSTGSGHVMTVIRKHPEERKWQLWDTGTSFYDPEPHPGAKKQARMLWESHWWAWIPATIGPGWTFQGIGLINGLGKVKQGLKPRGRCRLLLRRRKDAKLLFRSAWMSMEEEGLPITWLMRSLRGAPFYDQIEATWVVNSVNGKPSGSKPDNRPMLDCICDARGNATMTWTPAQGLHNRSKKNEWSPRETLGVGSSVQAAAVAKKEEGDNDPYA